MAKWELLCQADEVPPGARKVVPASALDILIFNTGKRWYACANECPHLGEPLEEGELQGHVIRCSAHGYKMDLSNGACVTEAGLEVAVFPIEVRDGAVWVKL
ncbi:MAG: Rieske 2Fe-2S domain-containing protein [Elusimicrobia bacterium]|nr:Rieske 2Fe-2S domain-containing protein [Elusimicrobiota bacterium]